MPAAGRYCAALSVVGLLGFWPTQIEKWAALADDILAPVRAVEAATAGRKAVVLFGVYQRPGRASWVNWPPAPAPENAAIWMVDAPGADALARTVFPERVVVRFAWENDVPTVRAVPPR